MKLTTLLMRVHVFLFQHHSVSMDGLRWMGIALHSISISSAHLCLMSLTTDVLNLESNGKTSKIVLSHTFYIYVIVTWSFTRRLT